jgi:hypothetical protein
VILSYEHTDQYLQIRHENLIGQQTFFFLLWYLILNRHISSRCCVLSLIAKPPKGWLMPCSCSCRCVMMCSALSWMPSSYAIYLWSCASELGSHVLCLLSLIATKAEAHGHLLWLVNAILFFMVAFGLIAFQKITSLVWKLDSVFASRNDCHDMLTSSSIDASWWILPLWMPHYREVQVAYMTIKPFWLARFSILPRLHEMSKASFSHWT